RAWRPGPRPTGCASTAAPTRRATCSRRRKAWRPSCAACARGPAAADMRRWWPGIRRRWRGSVAAVRRHPRKVALIAAPWLLALLVGLPVLWFEVDRAVREQERQGGREAVEYAAQSLLRWVAQLHQDAQFLAELTPRLLDAGQQAMLAETYTSFLLAGADYHKVRWVDAAGRERLRVDQDRGVVYLVPEPGLQDKGERPFVRLGLALQSGQVYLSPLDLN